MGLASNGFEQGEVGGEGAEFLGGEIGAPAGDGMADFGAFGVWSQVAVT